MKLADLETIAALIEANSGGEVDTSLAINWWPKSIALVLELGALPNATRVTFRYQPNTEHPRGHAIENAWLSVRSVMFNVSFDRPLLDGEGFETTWHSSTAPAISFDPSPKPPVVVEITPPRPTVTTDSRWSFLEID